MMKILTSTPAKQALKFIIEVQDLGGMTKAARVEIQKYRIEETSSRMEAKDSIRSRSYHRYLQIQDRSSIQGLST